MDPSIETQEQIENDNMNDNDGLNNEDFRKTIDQIILENRRQENHKQDSESMESESESEIEKWLTEPAHETSAENSKFERESKSTIENSSSKNELESAIARAQENVARLPENEDNYDTENEDDKILTKKIITGDAKMPARRKTDEEPEEMEMDANKPSYEELFPEQEGPHEE
jgi:hypothetical protein